MRRPGLRDGLQHVRPRRPPRHQRLGRRAHGGRGATPSSSSSASATTSRRTRPRIDLLVGATSSPAATRGQQGAVTYGGTLSGALSAYRRDHAPGAAVRLLADVHRPCARHSSRGPTWRRTGRSRRLSSLQPDQLPRHRPRPERLPVSAANLQYAQQIQIRVPDGATTLINVTGATYTSGFPPTYSITFWDGGQYVQFSDTAPNDRVGRPGGDLLWSFPDATECSSGTIRHGLAGQRARRPRALVTLVDNTRFHGTLIAETLEQTGTATLPRLRRLPAAAVSAGPDAHADTDRHAHLDADRHAHHDADARTPTLRRRRTPTPTPTAEPPPLPPDPIPPSPPDDPNPPSGGACWRRPTTRCSTSARSRTRARSSRAARSSTGCGSATSACRPARRVRCATRCRRDCGS